MTETTTLVAAAGAIDASKIYGGGDSEVRALDSYVDDTAQVFLGVRITCARCHNHPFEN